MKQNARLIVLMGVFFTSLSAIFTRLSDAPSTIIAFYRLLFTVLLLLPIIISKNSKEIKNITKKQLLLCVISGTFLAFHFVAYFASIKYTSIVNSTMLVNIHPIFVFAGGILLLKEKASFKSFLCILVALAGSTLISFGDFSSGDTAMLGNFLAAFAAFLFAGYMIIGRFVRSGLSNNVYTFVVYSSSVVVLFIINIATQTPLYPYATTNWLVFIGLAIFPTLLGHSIFNWALEYVSPSFISVSNLGEPVYATIMGMFLFKEFPTAIQVVGSLIILVGIGSFNYFNNKHQKKLELASQQN